MRSPTRRSSRPHVTAHRALAAATLGAVLLLAGCSSGDEGGGNGAVRSTATAAAQEVLLQPVAARGPDPFTGSTATAGTPSRPTTTPPDTPASPAPPQTVREVTGSTPGLYGGTRSEASCDVEQQVAFFAEDRAKARAFAEAAGLPETSLAGWLRGLTPVVLRADTRVTNHGYRDGAPTAFQSVLQAGTAVLVDQYGTPRVRCACGNPLRSPVAVQGATHKGRPWGGYHPDRVVVITPTTTVVTSLVIVNVDDNTWIERKTGTDGERDTRPAVTPPCDPADCHLTGTPVPVPSPSVTDGPTVPGEPTAPGDPSSPASPHRDGSPTTDCPSLPPATSPSEEPTGIPDTTSPDTGTPSIPPGCPTPAPSEPTAPEPPVEPLPETEPAPETDGPSFEDLFPSDTAPQQPETFEG
ncbi:DUF6777 domain-containing protein [Streptomyces sp. NPDC047981]|uniref:DUF6777 domain-containing protein n=1 Tax=Streptomyces sp. NPDC047981 TaxID=3154610 RepID=UPI003418E86E